MFDEQKKLNARFVNFGKGEGRGGEGRLRGRGGRVRRGGRGGWGAEGDEWAGGGQGGPGGLGGPEVWRVPGPLKRGPNGRWFKFQLEKQKQPKNKKKKNTIPTNSHLTTCPKINSKFQLEKQLPLKHQP